MDKQEGLSSNRALVFYGSNYTFRKIRMEVYLQSLGMDVWKSIEEEYKIPNVPGDSKENTMSQKRIMRPLPPK